MLEVEAWIRLKTISIKGWESIICSQWEHHIGFDMKKESFQIASKKYEKIIFALHLSPDESHDLMSKL